MCNNKSNYKQNNYENVRLCHDLGCFNWLLILNLIKAKISAILVISKLRE